MPVLPLFPVGMLAGPDDVVDREAFMADAAAELTSGQSLVVAGPRRTGKTSVGKAVLAELDRAGCHTAYVDLFFATGLESLATQLVQAVVSNRLRMKNRVIHSWEELLSWLGGFQVTERLAGLEVALTRIGPPRTPEQMLDAALVLSEQMAARDQKRLVVLLDEFQEVNRLGGTLLLQRMRAHFQQQRWCTYLFLGSQASLLNALFAERQRALYRFALLRDLPPVPDEAWRMYLHRKFEGAGVELTQAGADTLLARTGGHPYGLMQVANRAYVLLQHGARRKITADVAVLACQDVLRTLDRVYEAEWADVRRVKAAGRILEALARGESPYQTNLPAATVYRALAALVQQGVIYRPAPRARYRFTEVMFWDWLLGKLT